jgi:hypothetical protein
VRTANSTEGTTGGRADVRISHHTSQWCSVDRLRTKPHTPATSQLPPDFVTCPIHFPATPNLEPLVLASGALTRELVDIVLSVYLRHLVAAQYRETGIWFILTTYQPLFPGEDDVDALLQAATCLCDTDRSGGKRVQSRFVREFIHEVAMHLI